MSPIFPRILRSWTLCAAVLAVTNCAAGSVSAQAPVQWSTAIVEQEERAFASPEMRRLADSVVLHQSPEGGWPKNTDLAAPPGPPRVDRDNTIDNDATTLPMEFLARVIHAGGERYRPAFERGLDYLLAAQYANGGWPQFYPLRGGYYDHVTFNDNAMIRVMALLRDVANGEAPYGFVDAGRRARAAAAVERGLALILRTQIRQGGALTAWCAQYDAASLRPAWARAYEPPSLSGAESVAIVRFLMSIENPSPEVVAAVDGAVAWLRAAAIAGVRVESFTDAEGRPDRRAVADASAPPIWARFYELGANRPIFLGRDSVAHYEFGQIERERRAGYNYYGHWARAVLEDYPAWRARVSGEAR